ncbi:MAG: glycosyltransferase family 9 protein [Candidatus Omnitrophica bacterium]|nr:glycosyltransferase family 9 protein [Candidatus Omnitrophota bacterium]
MSGKPLEPSSVKNILVFSHSNIGDVVASCPVLDVLCRDFPSARVNVIVGPRAATLLEGNPRLRVTVYDKHMPWPDQCRWFLALRRERFDLIVDLRHTILPFVLRARARTPLQMPSREHMVRKHLDRLRTVHHFSDENVPRTAIVPKPLAHDVLPKGRFVVIAPSAADSAKRWTADGFVEVADFIVGQGMAVVFTGGAAETGLIEGMRRRMKNPPAGEAGPSLSLVGRLDLRELAFVLGKAAFAVVHDSGAMHIACYFGVPVIALFGPTDDTKSGPRDPKSVVIRRNGSCPRCLNPQSHVPHQCMAAIQAQDVIDVIQNKFL